MDFATIVRPQLEGLLEPGETLQGFVAATLKKTFSGSLCALGVTDRRLILLPLDRRIQPAGAPASIPPESLTSAEVDGFGSRWWANTDDLLNASLTLVLKTADGQKRKLMMMRGTGLLAGLGGGEPQRQGIEALAAWMEQREAGA